MIKMRIASVLLGTFLAASALAATEAYTLDPAHTVPTFEVTHLGFFTRVGRFDKTVGKVSVDRDTRKGRLEVTVEAASISTGHAKLDQHLRSQDFLHAEMFPALSFKSDEFTIDGDKLESIPGQLTIRGVTHPVTLQVASFKCSMHPFFKKEACGVRAIATIKRSEFGIKFGLPNSISDEVKLIIDSEAIKDS